MVIYIRKNLFFLFAFITLQTFCQEKKTLKDQLNDELSIAEKTKLYLRIAEYEIDNDSVEKYINKAKKNLKIYNDDDALAKIYMLKSKSFIFKKPNKDSVIYFLHKGLQLSREKETKAFAYKTLSNFYSIDSTTDSVAYYAEKTLLITNYLNYKIEVYFDLFNYYYQQKKFDLAKKNINNALAISEKHNNNYYSSRAYLFLGKLYVALNNYDLAIDFYEKGLEKVTKGSSEETHIYIWLGYLISLKYKNNYDDNSYLRVVEYYQKAIANEKKKNAPEEFIAQPMLSLAAAYLNIGNNKKGLETLNEMLSYGKKSRRPAFFNAYYARYKAEYLTNINKFNEAKQEYKNAIQLAEKIASNYLLADSWLQLGILQLETNEPLAEKSLLNAEKYGQIVNDPNVIPDVYIYLKDVYEKQNDYKNAFYYINKHVKIKDSLNKIENYNAIQNYILKNETLEKENKILQLEKDNEEKEALFTKEKQKYILISSVIVFLILITYAAFYFKRKKKRLQSQLELQNQKELLEVRNQLLENISHEIRTPVSVINGYLHLIQQQSTNSNNVKKYANFASKNTNAILNNFNNFLSLTSKDKNDLTIAIQNKNLNEFLNDTLSSFSGFATFKNLGLYLKTNVYDTLSLDFDFDKLQKILNNLISNAIKYTDTNKNIYLNVVLSTNSLRIVVKDQGYGIPKDEHDLVFKRFYQSKSHKVSGGFGIGLSFTKELVELLNGSISLESEPQIGSVFTLEFPINKENISLYLKDKKPEYEAIIETIEQIELTNNNLPKVLIVEDNLLMTRYLKEILIQHYNCSFANNGAEALNKVKVEKFDLVISDYRMPVMDGLTFKKELNNLEQYNNTPFLLLTAYSFSDIENLKLRLGIEDYLAKPFSYQEIITRTRKLLENTIYLKKIKDFDNEIAFDGHIDSLINKVKNLVVENMANSDYTIADLASDCGYGQKQLGRIIKASTGLTVVKLILEIRLQKAYELILTNKYATLMEVIYAVGLNNRSYFNKKFEDRFGIKPGELNDKK